MARLDFIALIVKQVCEKIDLFIHGYNTTFAKSQHNKKLRYTAKRKASYYANGRVKLASLDTNDGRASTQTEVRITSIPHDAS